jgi:hypothetical protein
MTVVREALTEPVPSLVLLAGGSPVATVALQAQVGPALAVALGLDWAAPLDPLAPDAALTALPPGALVPLPRDPGHPLAEGTHWAEVLGAWRQPVLLLIEAAQLDSGLAAATTALLQRWQVPLLGLVQCGGRWDEALRRRENLPWLGGWWAEADPAAATAAVAAGEGAEPDVALLLAIRRRWRQQLAALV